ncbi:MAG: hypothetical protein ACR2HR_12915 [Euzebya sp.]
MTRPDVGRQSACHHHAAGAARLAVVTVGLILVLGLLVMPAWAVREQSVSSPASGAVLDGPIDVVARIVADDGEVIQSVDARLRGPGERTVSLEPDGPPAQDGSQLWRGQIDPMAGLVLPNGAYVMEVRSTPLVGDPTAYSGVDVRLAAPPPQRNLSAGPSPEQATSVLLNWDTVAVPDFIAYRIQRRTDDAAGQWQTVHDLTDPREGAVTDQVPQPAAYRYRLIVVRGDGVGGEVFATSTIRGVRADPDDPGTFVPPPEPQPRPANTPAPQPGNQSPISRPTDAAQGPSPGSPQTGTAQTPTGPTGSQTVRAPNIRPPEQAAPAPPRPGVIPLDDGVFDDILPFEVTESEMEVGQTETAFNDADIRPGGSLAIYTEQSRNRPAYTAAAAGLLLLVISAHVRRFLADGGRR